LQNVVTGFLVLLPLYLSSLNSTTYFRAAAATAFLGGSIFEIGSYLMVVEALNRLVILSQKYSINTDEYHDTGIEQW
jgi:zinc transporter ZupT